MKSVLPPAPTPDAADTWVAGTPELPMVVVEAAEEDDPATAERVVAALQAFMDDDTDGAP